jgi:hypothetical protein
VLRTLHNPRYAGAFVFGRHRWRPGPGGRAIGELQPRERWTALIRDAHPGLHFLGDLRVKPGPTAWQRPGSCRRACRRPGPAREGPALAQGLAICGRCGRRMTVRYHSRNDTEVPDYQSMATCISADVTPCLRVPGAGIDHRSDYHQCCRYDF